MLFITEICVKALLLYMLIAWHSTYSPQFMRTVLHLVSFRYARLPKFFCLTSFLGFLFTKQKDKNFNTINEINMTRKRYVM